MTPIRFACEETLPILPREIAEQMLEVANWTDFRGYAFIPAIKSAEFEVRTPEVIGSRIKVNNADGSSHVEEIIEWEPERRVAMRFQDLSPPLSRLTTGFVELWDFKPTTDGTHVTRSFELHAKSAWAWPVLKLISLVLRRAVARHLRQMRESVTS
jgi:hypothetical protein